MPLILPPSVAEAERRRFNHDVLSRVTIEHSVCREWTDRLRRYDDRLFMVKAHDLISPGAPLKPGYYHVLRRNDGAPMSVFVVEGADGEFVEPTGRVFERLAAGDLRNPSVMRELRERPQRERAAADRRRDEQNEARRETLRERVDAGTRAQVSMNPDTPWSQNAAGRRGAKR